ncbi:MAG: hypothetical protein R6W95_13755 [Desulfosarcina sp.]
MAASQPPQPDDGIDEVSQGGIGQQRRIWKRGPIGFGETSDQVTGLDGIQVQVIQQTGVPGEGSG